MQRSDVGLTSDRFPENDSHAESERSIVNAWLATYGKMRERDNVGTGTGACLTVQSFLALSTAIALGPLATVSRRQISLGLLFTTAGFLTALLQAVIGGTSFRRNGRTVATEDVMGWDLLLAVLLPILLVGFWAALGVWVLYAS